MEDLAPVSPLHQDLAAFRHRVADPEAARTVPQHNAQALRDAQEYTAGRCFKPVDPVSDCPPKLVPIDEEANDQIVHLFRLGETDRAADQSLDPRP